ncbi:MAG: methyltransferase domain-containing protein [Methylococcaceae bacterium]|nr:methyltransferase domain-containing protein [Methylococcaceae bacterium]
MRYQWNPEDYTRHSSGQERWARELLGNLALRPDDAVLDIGCGAGRITAAIAEGVSRGRVVGLDLSQEMIRYAQTHYPASRHPNLAFQQGDASRLPFEAQFSLIFSNAALHWIRDHRPVLAGIARALQAGGRCLMEMGGHGSAAALIEVFEAVAEEEPWADAFVGFESSYGFHDAEHYGQWLCEAGLEAERVQLIDKDMVHADRESFTGWLRTAWHPYTSPVQPETRQRFIDAVAARYLAEFPPDAGNQVHVAMVRLQVEARKP